MNQHTPGPLNIVFAGSMAGSLCHMYIADKDGRKIAALWGKSEEKEGNAFLFTRAPEMLTALEYARRIIADQLGENSAHLAPIDAAINGARGLS